MTERSYEDKLINYFKENQMSTNPVEIVLPEEIIKLNFESNWKDILSDSDRNNRVQKTINLWIKHASNHSIIINLFKTMLVSIDTIIYKKELMIVYSIKSNSDEMLYYIGTLPKISYPDVINKLPHEIKDFYYNVHDGFMIFPLEDMGINPSNKISCLGDYLLQEEYLDGMSVNDSYMIFTNGCSDGIVYDLSKNPSKGFTFYHDNADLCNFDKDVIEVMDTWIYDSLTEEY